MILQTLALYSSEVATFFVDTPAQPDDPKANVAINIATFLTVLCWVFLVAFVATRFVPTLRTKFSDFFGDRVYFLAWLVPFTAMVLSLYFSEVLAWRPCPLCWYQRGFIYTLAVLCLINYFKRSKYIRIACYVLGAISPFVSAYHISIERSGGESLVCSLENSCATVWFTSIGFLTTPAMALTASITTVVLVYMTSKFDQSEKETAS